MTDDGNQQLRLAEAILFAAREPVSTDEVGARLPDGSDAEEVLKKLQSLYENRGVNIMRPGGKWAFRTAPDLGPRLDLERETQRRLSRAGVETLAVISYHQPITRAEIEEIRGVAVSRGTLDVLLECGWIRPGRRRQTPGRPVTWVTTSEFLNHFGLESLKDLPGLAELREAGLLDTQMSFDVYASRAETDNTEDDQAADDLLTEIEDELEASGDYESAEDELIDTVEEGPAASRADSLT
jgi:segregation and condensation protein B